eukprot:11574-Pleurochrysis_carterae.AAC.1
MAIILLNSESSFRRDSASQTKNWDEKTERQGVGPIGGTRTWGFLGLKATFLLEVAFFTARTRPTQSVAKWSYAHSQKLRKRSGAWC